MRQLHENIFFSRKPYDPDNWEDEFDMQIFHTINAFYKLYKNEFTLSPWILAGVFYYPKIPKYLNFGGLGTVIGHEITHGFDNTGRNLNYLGI